MANIVTRAFSSLAFWRSERDAEEKATGGRKSLGKRAVPDQSLYLQMRRIGGQLTPTQVSAILREADTGDMRRLIDLENDLRQKDCHLQAVLSQAEESIAGLDWSLVLPADARAKDKRAAEWLDNYLRVKVAAAFDRMIAHQSGSFYHAHAVSETMWGKDDGRLVPVDWENLSARRFGYRGEDAAFIWRDETMPFTGVDIRAEYPNKFVVSHPRVNGDIQCREGLGRLLIWPAIFRNWDLTDWLRTGEASWKPWRIGTYDKNASAEDIQDLETVLDELTTNGWASIPSTDKIEIEWPAGNQTAKSTHSELYNVLAQEMSKATLGQTETVQASGSSGYAQAKVHENVSLRILKARSKQISAVITRDVIRPIIELNFGSSVAIPAFKFTIDDSVDMGVFATGISALAEKAKLRMPAAWIRAKLGMPEPDDDDEVIGGSVDIPIDPKTGLPTVPEDPMDPKPDATPKPTGDSAAENADDVEDAPTADDPKTSA